MTEYIREGLLILIPFLITIGKIARIYGLETKWIPLLLLSLGIAAASVCGLVTSTLSGWRYIIDSIFITGVLQGSVAAFTSMGLYGHREEEQEGGMRWRGSLLPFLLLLL